MQLYPYATSHSDCSSSIIGRLHQGFSPPTRSIKNWGLSVVDYLFKSYVTECSLIINISKEIIIVHLLEGFDLAVMYLIIFPFDPPGPMALDNQLIHLIFPAIKILLERPPDPCMGWEDFNYILQQIEVIRHLWLARLLKIWYFASNSLWIWE